MEKMPVIQALQQSSKGILEYEYKLKNQPCLQKLDFLDECNPLPPFSPEIERLLLAKQVVATAELPSEVIPTGVKESAPVDSPSTDDVDVGEDPSVISIISTEIAEYETSLDDELIETTNAAVEYSRNWFKKSLQKLIANGNERFQQEEKERQQKLKQQQETLRLAEIRMSVAIDEWKQVTLEKYRAEEEIIEAKLADGELQAKKIIELKEERMKKMYNQFQREYELVDQELTACLHTCQYPQLLPAPVISGHKTATENIKALLKQSTFHFMENQMDSLRGQLNNVKIFLEQMKVVVQEANRHGAEQAAKEQELLQQRAERLELERLKLEEEHKKKLIEDKKKQMEQKKDVNVRLEGPKVSSKEASHPSSTTKESSNTDLGMPKSMVSEYTKLQNMLSCTSSSTKSLSESKDPSIKKYRFDLQKAVNITVNSISANSGEGLIEKINLLQSLIGGRPVNIIGKQVDTTHHPEAKLYCCNLLAKKLVKQGEDQVSSNMETAFPVAAVAIALWSKHPDIGDHILAHFHSVCPCLVPLYIPKSKGMSDGDQMKLQGYRTSASGVVETEDMFLHRMRGVIRLYAAIISSPQLPMNHSYNHPHGLDHGWAWLSRVLNMDPHPTFTAAALGDFLEIAGHALMKRFGRQFQKLLYALCRNFVPKMEKCTPSSQRGPISRLTQFLENSISTGKFSEPKGFLKVDFWRTRSRGVALA